MNEAPSSRHLAPLSNDPEHCDVMNLGYGPNGHGPYLVRQEGYVPGSMDLRPQRFILQKDGRWLLNLAFVMMPEAEQEKQLFQDLTEVLRFLDAQGAQPVRADAALPPGTTPEEIMTHFEQCTHRILKGMRNGCVIPARP
jgi:hypothetical protein